MEEHGDAEDAENDVDLPGDVLEGRRNEVGEGEVKGPVEGGRECNCFTADA